MKKYAPFKFKQFEVQQEKSAMKVGTDGVLLGAWCPIPESGTVLDIGCGTGLISLMLAQRNKNISVTGIEIDPAAAEESAQNFAASPWSKRLNRVETSLQNFSPKIHYDLVVSNPPYFTEKNNFLSKGNQRQSARMDTSLNFDELCFHTQRLLKQNGKAAFILPMSEWEYFEEMASKHYLFVSQICQVKGRENLNFKRILTVLSKSPAKNIEVDQIILEIDRHQFTEAYMQLTRDFYLSL
jgi:tRNA1Val (adenine37-N6)-methyltransferase